MIQHVPGLVFGCMTFGGQVDSKTAKDILTVFKDHQNGMIFDLDTAYVYTEGRSETILGDLLVGELCPSNLYLATKVNPRIGLSPENVKKQLEESLNRLKRKSVDLLYLHSPDHKVPIVETLRACQELYTEGKFKELGLSNYTSWQVADIYHICHQNGWVKPTVYQGMYNVLTRSVEKELIPALRKFGLRFYVYNPLAGGLLTGKYDNEQPVEGSRFTLPSTGEMYKQRYWKPSFLKALKILNVALQEHNTSNPQNPLTLLQLTFSWLNYHSILQQNDTIILGASSLDQLKQNLKALDAGRLPESILKACEEAYAVCACDCPSYFR